MSKILVLKSSFMLETSLTNYLIDVFLDHRRVQSFADDVVEYDLNQLNLPVLDAEIFHALNGEQNADPRIQNIVSLSDRLIKELKESDILLIGVPMYNLNVPTPLKNWFDLIARAGITFKYTETYPLGLVEGVKAVIFSSSGGLHVGNQTDVVTPYLNSVLGLIGINDVKFIYAEGIEIKPNGRKKGLSVALTQIDNHFAA